MENQRKTEVMIMQNLNVDELLSPWLFNLPVEIQALTPSSLTLDSRAVKLNSMFVAIKGHAVDGRQFISSAIEQGASLILSQADSADDNGKIIYQDAVVILSFFELNLHLSALARRFFSYPDQEFPIVAVTGTNGKTTISQILAQWANLLGHCSGIMGTTGNGVLSDLKEAQNTTGSAIEIQSVLRELRDEGADFAAMEVSSHGLVQGRVKDMHFAASIFTNLSRDHLDYHGTMENYAEAKKRLFTQHHSGLAIINGDDDVGAQWLKELAHAVRVTTQLPAVITSDQQKFVALTSVNYRSDGVAIEFDSSWGRGAFRVSLVGAFNVMNVLLALATLLSLGYPLTLLVEAAPQLCAVIGRMEVFQASDKPMMVVDYAHTPDALEKALSALRIHCHGTLWCLIGCGGDRDVGKRPLMASIAEHFADNVILTDDNPRSESPIQIMEDMKLGLTHPDHVLCIHDRYQACEWALTHGDKNDIILVAGKGHEDYQIFADKTIHYSDRETVKALLEDNQ